MEIKIPFKYYMIFSLLFCTTCNGMKNDIDLTSPENCWQTFTNSIKSNNYKIAKYCVDAEIKPWVKNILEDRKNIKNVKYYIVDKQSFLSYDRLLIKAIYTNNTISFKWYNFFKKDEKYIIVSSEHLIKDWHKKQTKNFIYYYRKGSLGEKVIHNDEFNLKHWNILFNRSPEKIYSSEKFIEDLKDFLNITIKKRIKYIICATMADLFFLSGTINYKKYNILKKPLRFKKHSLIYGSMGVVSLNNNVIYSPLIYDDKAIALIVINKFSKNKNYFFKNGLLELMLDKNKHITKDEKDKFRRLVKNNKYIKIKLLINN